MHCQKTSGILWQYTQRVARLRCTSKKYSCVVSSFLPDQQLPSGNLVSHVFADAAKWNDRIATECASTGRRYTYAQLLDRVARWSGMLRELGVGRGDVVAVALPNCPEYPIVYFGTLALGATVTPVNITYTAEEIARQLKDSNTKVLVGDALLSPTLGAALDLYRKPTPLVTNGHASSPESISLRQVLEDPSVPFVDPVELTGKETAMLPYSSGTTGNPKGVIVSHNSLSANMTIFRQLSSVEQTTEYTEIRRHKRQIKSEEKMEHAARHIPRCCALLPYVWVRVCGHDYLLRDGAKVVTAPRFDSKTFVDSISKHKVTLLYSVPPILNFLKVSPAATPEALGTLRAIVNSAAPAAPSTVDALMDKLSPTAGFQDGYGMTECNFLTMVPFGETRSGTIGKLLPNVKAKVIDTATGEPLGPLADGELCFKTPSVMDGYYNNAAATAEAVDEEGWLHSGDVGRYDEDGFLAIVGRTKELIKVKGLQVSPSELEDVILQHPEVVDVVEFLEPRVAPHKRLAGGVFFVDELPRSAAGKLLRKELKKLR
nr:probable 4-coumarate--CoA ligase 3 [Penaeus vannamei]